MQIPDETTSHASSTAVTSLVGTDPILASLRGNVK